MKIGERGQVTIPKSMRERFGLAPSSEVEFVEERGELILRKLQYGAISVSERRKRIQANVGILDGHPTDIDQSIEDMRGR